LLLLADEAGLVAERLVPALLGIREIFGDDLRKDPRFVGPVTVGLSSLLSQGAKQTVASLG
jgi:fructuronate reductase